MRRRRYSYGYQEYIERRNKILIILTCIISILIVLFVIFHPHSYVLKQQKYATCTESGYEHYECWCKASYTSTTPAKGHDYLIYTQDSTCEKEGYISYLCMNCQYHYQEKIPKKEHKFKQSRIEPTCEEEGSITNTCEFCGYTYSEVLDKVDHDYEEGKCKYCGKQDENYKVEIQSQNKISNETNVNKSNKSNTSSKSNSAPPMETTETLTYPQLPAVVRIEGDTLIVEKWTMD
jgi:hypothetical protein